MEGIELQFKDLSTDPSSNTQNVYQYPGNTNENIRAQQYSENK
jgi:hypothetical protein